MAKTPVNLAEDTQPISELEVKAADQDPRERLELLIDIRRGLADAEAGRVTPHETARFRLLARYS
jgi:predicted transcriptional regulator